MLTLPIISPYARSVAENIAADGLGNITTDAANQSCIEIINTDVYRIDSDRLAHLNAPAFFPGFMTVDMTGNPAKEDCHFAVQFSDEQGQPMHGLQRDGCVLRLNQYSAYLLPQAMFDLWTQVDNVKTAGVDESLRWKVIERAKNSSERIRFTALPDSTIFTNSHHVSIDVVRDSDGSVRIKPRIDGVSEYTHGNYMERLNEEGRTVVVMTEVRGEGADRHVVRQITDADVIRAHRRLAQVGRIPREDVAKFLDNPAAFILGDEESADNVPINFHSYRITGIGEPYVGYFGSKNLDSPIKIALMQDGDPQVKEAIRQAVIESVKDKSKTNIEALKTQVEDAQASNAPNIVLPNGEGLPAAAFGEAIAILDKVLRRVQGAGAGSNDKLVIQIDPNDEEGLIVEFATRIPLSEICINNQDTGDLFHNIVFPPKSYQISGINWLKDLFDAGYRGGILADDMGLGKTYQIVVFMRYLLSLPQYRSNNAKRLLIVAPTILLDNWRDEIEKFIEPAVRNAFRVKIVRGNDLGYRNNRQRQDERSFNSFDVANFLEVEGNPNVFLISYETLANYQFSFVDPLFNWGCVIYDEAHKIKNPNAQLSQAARALSSLTPFSALLTGTPIENELRDLWALFDVFDPAHFGAWKKFKQEFVVNSDNVDTRLRERVSNYLLRRFKKDYLGNELPGKFEHVYEVEFGSSEVTRYHEIRNQQVEALKRLQGLKAFGLHPDLRDGGHNNPKLQSFSKTKKLLSVLKEIETLGEKAIVFVTSRMAQDFLRFGIQAEFGINVSIINGDNNSPAQVKEKLDVFKSTGGFAVIILSTLAAGVGLTITEANHVIHYERWWNASKEDQASDRAYRIGAKRDVHIHHIIGSLPSDHGAEHISFDQALNKLIQQKRNTAGYLVPPKNVQATDIIGETMSATLKEKVAALDWRGFEDLIMRLYEAQGCLCERTPDYPAREYGADIIGKTREGAKFAIQCKHTSKDYLQETLAIHQLNDEAREYYQAGLLIAMTNGVFSPAAKDLAERVKVKLVDWDGLSGLLIKHTVSL